MFLDCFPLFIHNCTLSGKEVKIRIPQQERSRKTKARILRSAEDLFSKKGFHKTNSKEIAKHAGVAVGNFYAYFKNKKAVLLELLEGYNQQVFASILTFLESRDLTTDNPRDFFVSMIESILKAHDHIPDYYKDITPSFHSDPDVKAMMNQFHRVSLEKIKGLMLQFKDILRISDLDAAAVLVLRIVEDTTHGIKYDKETIGKERLVSELTDMLCRYLLKQS
jgi:AcrR family transcriptional regulator